MMQFSTTSDYAIRTVLYLALHAERCCTAGEIEENMKVPATYLHKVTKQLKNAGIVRAVKGNGGGYTLMKAADQTSLYDILSLTEQTLEINGCLENEAFCSRHSTDICPVRKVYTGLNAMLKEGLKQATIKQLLM
ncbi:RrF2 family transcriptional regulator [Flavonifractor sp. An112]|uniref:RrF2 family transcriptional regulator n=1 Tax=Flavonifractor sp. An112 TaxID=1965544 RepID=UPI001302B7DC|nr:Rrf2 family transcriptional regulator [Flavonifractor sp. An112]